MATVVLLTSALDIKDHGFVDENVDEKIIRACIESAQDIYTQKTIGTGLFNELKTQKQAGTLTALNTTLLSYIQKSLRYWVLWEGLDTPGFQYKIRNKGVMKSSSDNSQDIETSELFKTAESFKNRAEFYDQRLVAYLEENDTDYPLYTNPGNGIDIIHPSREAYSIGWVLGNSGDCKMRGGPDSTIDL